MKVTAGAYTSKGSVRPHNEDSFLCAYEQGCGIESGGAGFSGSVEAPLFFLVADGMGGHDAGDAASTFVVESMYKASKLSAEEKNIYDETMLENLIKSIHVNLTKNGIERGTPKMGTTLSGILLRKDGHCAFLNAGDSRVYRLRNGFIQQLSRDDSLASIVPGAASNLITNAIGAGLPDVKVSSRFSSNIAVTNDIFLICSDGVHGFLSDEDFEKLLIEKINMQETHCYVSIAKQIVELAITNNSDDNCTAMVVRIEA